MKRYALLCAIALAGCASAPVHWDKPGATQQDLNVDAADCRMKMAGLRPIKPDAPTGNAAEDAGNAALTTGVEQMRDQNFMNDCLTAHGWVASQ